MRESNLGVIHSFYGTIGQTQNRSNTSQNPSTTVLKYETDLPSWDGHAGEVLRVSKNGRSLEWYSLDLDRTLSKFFQKDRNAIYSPGAITYVTDEKTLSYTPNLKYTGSTLSVNVDDEGFDWAALDVKGNVFIRSENDNGLRIQPNVSKGKYGFSDRYGNMVVFTNEQGTINTALVIGDPGIGNSNAVIFGVSTCRNAENPSIGDESWVGKISLTGAGNLWIAGSLFQSSDVRLKTNVNDIKYGLNEVLQLRPVTYSMKDNEEETNLGFIAQEVEKVIPEIVQEHGGYKSIAYDKLVPVLVQAVKELSERLETQAHSNTFEFEKYLDTLESEIDILNNQMKNVVDEIEECKLKVQDIEEDVDEVVVELSMVRETIFERVEQVVTATPTATPTLPETITQTFDDELEMFLK